MFDFFTESACQTDNNPLNDAIQKKYETLPAEPESENISRASEQPSDIINIQKIVGKQQANVSEGETPDESMTAEEINLKFDDMNQKIDNLNLLKMASERAQKLLSEKKEKLGNEFQRIETLKSSLKETQKLSQNPSQKKIVDKKLPHRLPFNSSQRWALENQKYLLKHQTR